MKYWIVGLLGLLIFVLCPLSSESADRVFNESWDVDKGSANRMDLQWFGGDSIDYTHRAMQGRRPVCLTNTNQTLLWQVTGSGSDKTNSYLAVTGTVQQAAGVVEFSATPALANFPPGDYLGFVRSITFAGGGQTNAVTLAYQNIQVDWSPESDTMATASPLPVLDYNSLSNYVNAVSSNDVSIIRHSDGEIVLHSDDYDMDHLGAGGTSKLTLTPSMANLYSEDGMELKTYANWLKLIGQGGDGIWIEGQSIKMQTDVLDLGTNTVLRFHGTINGTNRVAEIGWDFTNNVFSVEVTDE